MKAPPKNFKKAQPTENKPLKNSSDPLKLGGGGKVGILQAPLKLGDWEGGFIRQNLLYIIFSSIFEKRSRMEICL